MFEPHTSHGHARGPVFQSESSVPSLKLTRSALHPGVAHSHKNTTSVDRTLKSDTLTQHHARTGPSRSLAVASISSYGYLPHHLVDPLLFGSVLHRPSSRHCLASHSGRPCHENCSPQPSLSSPSGVSSSSLWLAGGRGGHQIRRIHGRELQQRVQLGLRGRTLCLSGDAPRWHGGRGPSTAARKQRQRS